MINVMVDSNLMEVAKSKNDDKLFPAVEKSPHRKPFVSYTTDGRKLLDGIPANEQVLITFCCSSFSYTTSQEYGILSENDE